MPIQDTQKAASGTLKFRITQISDGASADMKENVTAAVDGLQQSQKFKPANAAAQHTSNFETRWRPVLNHLEALKELGDHISEVNQVAFACLGSIY
jgi:hypothetical protein